MKSTLQHFVNKFVSYLIIVIAETATVHQAAHQQTNIHSSKWFSFTFNKLITLQVSPFYSISNILILSLHPQKSILLWCLSFKIWYLWMNHGHWLGHMAQVEVVTLWHSLWPCDITGSECTIEIIYLLL